jgi:hypothetical protein
VKNSKIEEVVAQLVRKVLTEKKLNKAGKNNIQENTSTELYNKLQKEVTSLIMKGNIEVKNYPNFKLSEKENTELQAKGLIPNEIYKTTSGAEYLRFKVNDLKLEDELGKRFVDVPVNKEVKARFKDIPSTSKYNDKPVSIYKRSRNMPDERSSD